MIITEMDRSQCLAVLREQRHGRLACVSDGQPYVVPVTYAADGDNLYGFSLEGRKIEWMRRNPKVCMQVDVFDQAREWRSVIAYGQYEELPDRVGWKLQRDRAWSLLSREAEWWAPGGFKPVTQAPAPHLFYRIVVEEVTGRHAFEDENG